MIVDIHAEIRTGYLLNTILWRYRYGNLRDVILLVHSVKSNKHGDARMIIFDVLW